MEPFITGEDIETREGLFGRNIEIETLLSLARRHEMAGIIAPRRFGKTCILKTMRTILSEEDGDAYPIYFSAHDYGVSDNTDETYRRMATVVATQMCKDGLIPKGKITLFRKTKIRISTDEIDNYESFCELSPERQRESVFKLAELLRTEYAPKRYLLLLFDEVDYMLLTAFESPDDFMRLRTAATKKQAVLKFWVAGPASWKSITNSVGSPGLNCGIQNISLLPLDVTDFKQMWEYECSLIEDEVIKNTTLSKMDFAYHKSGGVPFYAKFIGRQYQILPFETKDPSYIILRDHLKEMYENRFFSQEEKEIMVRLARRPLIFDYNEPDGVKLLIEKGVARKCGEYTELTMDYLADYLRSSDIEINSPLPKEADNNETAIVQELVNEIYGLIDSINESFRAKKGKFVFETPKQQEVFDDDKTLRRVCKSSKDFGELLSVVYLMYYERSKATRSDTGTMQVGQRIFEVEKSLAFRNRTFFKIIEPLRAAYSKSHLAEKLERHTELGQLDQYGAMELLKGDRNPPEIHEWPILHIKILELFKHELEIIKKKVFAL